jgi:hypothetical protein
MSELIEGEIFEFSNRKNAGLDVRLCWIIGSKVTYVTVFDEAEQRMYNPIPVPEGINPNEVFSSPFSYTDER